MLETRIKSPTPSRIAVAVALAISSFAAQADVTVNSIEATGYYQLGTDTAVNLSSSGSPSVDVLAFPYSSGNSAGLHSYGSDSGEFGSRSSGNGIYDVRGSFRITETITNNTGSAQNATFNFFITPGYINNQIGSALTGTNYVSAGLNFSITKNGSSVWGSSATLTSNASGTTYTTTGDASLYHGSDTYYSIDGTQKSIDLGVINAGQSITLSYEMSSFANGVSVAGPDRLVPETTYHVPGQWVDVSVGDYSSGYGTITQYQDSYDVTIPAYTIPGAVSGSQASSGDPFDIDWAGNPYVNGRTASSPFGTSVSFTAAVPEPSEYALMLAGLGLLGWVTRRRRSQGAS